MKENTPENFDWKRSFILNSLAASEAISLLAEITGSSPDLITIQVGRTAQANLRGITDEEVETILNDALEAAKDGSIFAKPFASAHN